MKIFIVEDEENIVRLLKDELMQWGYTVESVKDFQRVSDEVEEAYPAITDFIGRKKSVNFLMSPSSFFRPTASPWTWCRPCNSERMTIS